jgi:hypothetical protein
MQKQCRYISFICCATRNCGTHSPIVQFILRSVYWVGWHVTGIMQRRHFASNPSISFQNFVKLFGHFAKLLWKDER